MARLFDNKKPAMSDRPANPGIPNDQGWNADTTAEQPRMPHPSDLPLARELLLKGDAAGAQRRLGTIEPAIPVRDPKPDGVRFNLIWNIMNAEACIAAGQFEAAQAYCANGLRRERSASDRGVYVNDVYSPILRTISAEAERRMGPLSEGTIYSLETMLRSFPEPDRVRRDYRYDFVEYIILRAIGLNYLPPGYTIGDMAEGNRYLAEAQAARDRYLHPTTFGTGRITDRVTPRHESPGALADSDKLRDLDESPMFSAVMKFPYPTDY